MVFVAHGLATWFVDKDLLAHVLIHSHVARVIKALRSDGEKYLLFSHL